MLVTSSVNVKVQALKHSEASSRQTSTIGIVPVLFSIHGHSGVKSRWIRPHL